MFRCGSTANHIIGWEFVWVYRRLFTLHPAEIDNGRWITPEELARESAEDPKAFARSFLYLWRQLEAEGKKH